MSACVTVHHRGPTIINYDGAPADSLHLVGTHIFHGPVIINWHALSRFEDSGWRRFVYYSPVTINYVGQGTYDASIRGEHTFKDWVTVNYTAAACRGTSVENKLGVNTYDGPVAFNLLADWSPVPGCVIPFDEWDRDAQDDEAWIEAPAFADLRLDTPPPSSESSFETFLTPGSWPSLGSHLRPDGAHLLRNT